MSWRWEPENYYPNFSQYSPPIQPYTTTGDPIRAIKKHRKFLKELEEELKPKDKKEESKEKKRNFTMIETLMLTCMISVLVGPAIGLGYFMVIANLLKTLR